MPVRRLLPSALVAVLAVLAALLAVPAQAATNGTISGTVTKAGGQPVHSVGLVRAFKASDPDAYPAQASIYEGTYSLSLPPGQYLVRFSAPSDDGDELAPEWWENSPNRGDSTPITVVSGEVFTADVDLPLAGSISGHVATNHPTFGHLDTDVWAYQADSSYPGGWAKLTFAGADENGDYRLRGLPAGDYRLHFYSQLTHYEGWWPNATTLAGATTIPVAVGDTETGKDPVLAKAGTISGKVAVSSTGAPVKGALVQMYQNFGHGFVEAGNEWWGSTTTATDGTYTLHAPADVYKIRFIPPTATRLRPEYWNNVTKLYLSTSVTVAPATDVANVTARLKKNTFTLTAPAAITGTLKVGQFLRAVPPKSTPTSALTTYQWLRNGKAISGAGAKKSVYKLVAADRGTKIGVKITLNRTGYVPAVRKVTRKFTVK